MKITTDRLLSFVKNNPQHFNDLHPLIKIYFDKYPVRSCGFCPNAIKPKELMNSGLPLEKLFKTNHLLCANNTS